MAQVTVTTIEKVVCETGYTLTLDEAEASVLVEVLSRVGGCPNTSARANVSGIVTALQRAGVESPWFLVEEEDEPVDNHRRSIYFKEDTKQ